MFRRLPPRPADPPAGVTITVDDRPCRARAGDSVAAALLAEGFVACRTAPVSGAPRGPFCMMGVCFECLVEIDGRASRQACQVRVADGMRITLGHGRRALAP
jgi:predicted molibdopterin-dependent oxidoreductase YjgC